MDDSASGKENIATDNIHEATTKRILQERNNLMESDKLKLPQKLEDPMEYETEQLNNEYNLTIESLPPEIFMHICTFLHAKFVIKTLSSVCKAFHSLISSDSTWKIRIAKRWPKKYPAIPVNDSEFNWKQACIEREERYRVWSSYPAELDVYTFREGLYASVDSVHLMNAGQLLAVGSRDRYLNLLDLSKLESGNPDSISKCRVWSNMKAHKGWIWSITSHNNILATGSWDTYVKFWDLDVNGEERHKVKTKSAVLCTHYEDNTFIAGGYDKKVYHIDPRVAGIVAEKKYHDKPVLALTADDQQVITASEDATVAVYDRRAASVIKTLQFEQYPMCLSYGRDQLWVGDKGGKVHLIDATDGDFLLVDTYDVGHTNKVTGIIHTLGALYTCSTDKTLKVLEPNLKPGIIKNVDHLQSELAEMAYQNEVLVGACSNASVVIWKPRP